LNQIEQYQQQLPHYREALALLAAIRGQRRLLPPPDAAAVFFGLTDKVAEERWQKGLALVDATADECDWSRPRAYFLELLQLSQLPAAASRQISAEIEAYPETYAGNLATLLALRPPYLRGEELDLGAWLLAESAAPWLRSLSRRFADRLKRRFGGEEPDYRCPVCASPAGLSLLREEEGFRWLYCPVCDAQWPVSRRRCPFCGNQESETLAYFTLDDQEQYRVDVCYQCHGYLKTFDCRKLALAPDLELENLITLHLDLRARSEGFH
jgi:FdhE protein